MMFGTVMMSNSTQNVQPNSSESASAPISTNTASVGQINSISHMIQKSYHEYMSDADQISEHSGVNINKKGLNYSSNQRFNKNNGYVLDDQGLTLDQLPMPAMSNVKATLVNEVSSNTNKYTGDSTADKLRKQQSHQHNRQISERSVNFSENEENVYSKIKIEKHSKHREHKRHEKVRESNMEHVTEARNTESKIQVQILPQDDNWGENTTTLTADFSDFNDDMTEDGRSSHFNFKSRMNSQYSDSNDALDDKQKVSFMSKLNFFCACYFTSLCAICVLFCAFVTPILFIILPRLNIWEVNECGLECEGLLVGIAFKMFILLTGAWALFARRSRAAQLPRIYEFRTLLVVLICFMTFSYWLFYAVRIIDTRISDYHEILEFTVSYVDVLLFIFIISVFVLEMRQMRPEYVVKVVRSPDGEQCEYNLGNMSIQRAAIWLLEQYYKDFPVYNPWLENTQKKRSAQLLKLEQSTNKKGRHGKSDDNEDVRSLKSLKSLKSQTASVVGGNFSANDRFYEEYEYERRLRKRRARLLTTTEEAFTHIRRIHNETSVPDENGLVPATMDPFETAQAVFTSIARDLRRYLRVTRQQPYFTRESIIAHLANCISYDMSPKSFLQRYLKAEPLIFNQRALVNSSANQPQAFNGIGSTGVNYHLNLKTMDQSWILICDTPLYQNCEDNLMLVLKQNEVSLMCTFKRMPRFNLIEDILDPQRNKFVIKFNSETTV